LRTSERRRLSIRGGERSRPLACLAAILALLLVPAPRAHPSESEKTADDWRVAGPDFPWSFPRDHWTHRDFQTEWWYFTGNLVSRDEPRRRFGYQFTLFRIGLHPGAAGLASDWGTTNLLMGHAAITDKDGGEHRFSEVVYREAPFLAQFNAHPDPTIAWSLGPLGTDATWELTRKGDGFALSMADSAAGTALELHAAPTRPMLLQGPAGFSRKSDRPGAASMYFSYTRMDTRGTLLSGDRSFEVEGVSWMDREWSSSTLTGEQIGWDWFGLRLDDGRDLMLFQLRRQDGSPDYGKGTLRSADGEVRYLSSADWDLSVTATWESPESGVSYPAAWSVELPSERLRLRIEPELSDQENQSSAGIGMTYWEGAVTVHGADGARAGEGYVELTGYGENNRPPL
jgi:predicted secreted hydrolase